MKIYRNRQRNYFLHLGPAGKLADYYLSLHKGIVDVTKITKEDANYNLVEEPDSRVSIEHMVEIYETTTLEKTDEAKRVLAGLREAIDSGGKLVGMQVPFKQAKITKGTEPMTQQALMDIVGTGAARIAAKSREKAEKVGTHQPKQKKASGGSSASPTDGFIVLKSICAGINVDPRDARKVLRLDKTMQRDGRWAWPATEVEKVKAYIVQKLAELKSAKA